MGNLQIKYCDRCGKLLTDINKILLYRKEIDNYVYYKYVFTIDLVECNQCWSKVYKIWIYNINEYIYKFSLFKYKKLNGYFLLTRDDIVHFCSIRAYNWAYMFETLKLDDWNLVYFEEHNFDGVLYLNIYKKHMKYIYLVKKLPIDTIFLT